MAKFASACVLSYNRPQFLPKMLHSLRENAGYPLELIVHDDGSSDADLIAYLHHLHRTGLISTLILNTPGHNQGVGTAMNRMFRLASGDPIIKLDHDLTFESDWLAKTVRILNENKDHYDLFSGERGPRIGALGAFKYHTDPVHHEKMHIVSREDWDEVEDFVGSFIAVPRDVWATQGPFEEHSDAFAEDIAFKRKLKAAGFAMSLPPEDIAMNHGFGPGPSTVVTAFDASTGQGEVASIHHGPKVFGE